MREQGLLDDQGVDIKNLTNIIYKYKNHNFSFAEGFDCAIFTVKVVEEYKEISLPLWKEVISYTTYKGALKAIKELGCKSLVDIPGLILGVDKKDISKVKLGEPVYFINQDNRGVLGICNGVRAYFLKRNGGLTTINIEDCLYCWSID